MDRIYFHYRDLEEYADGMWGLLNGDIQLAAIKKSLQLLRNEALLERAMLSVLDMWPNSCINAFTSESSNRLAWLGQAACCVSTGSPELATRKAWHMLSEHDQRAANAAARRVITLWEKANIPQLELFDA